MARLRAALAVLLASAVAALALAACGGEGDVLLPGETAEEIKANLNLVEERANEGDCFAAEDLTAEILFQVEELQVDRRLKVALEEGVELLNEVVDECEEAEEETTEPPETTDEELEEPEETEEEKPGKRKGQTEEAEPEEPEAEPEGGQEEVTPEQPSEPEESSGGVGPGAPVEGE